MVELSCHDPPSCYNLEGLLSMNENGRELFDVK